MFREVGLSTFYLSQGKGILSVQAEQIFQGAQHLILMENMNCCVTRGNVFVLAGI
jgi:hypothetical protein